MRRPAAWMALVLAGGLPAAPAGDTLPTDDGYRGIWYAVRTGTKLKYSGGLGTYPQQIRPFAVYSKKARKTFFCYGGRPRDKSTLLHMVSYYDHATQTVPRPRILLDKKTTDAHDNPCIALDDRGHVWIFSNTHGPAKRSYVHRSVRPYSVDAFERVLHASFSYGQPWFVPGQGFLFVHNRYEHARAVACMSSPRGRKWTRPRLLAQVCGQYQISAACGRRVAVAFNIHPGGLDRRTNLYYLETSDLGRTWRTVRGEPLSLPVKDMDSPALVHDYRAEKLLVYLKDIAFDAAGRPAILFLTSRSHRPGPAGGPRTWTVARWTGQEWTRHPVTTSDHNYDFGPLYVEPDGTWRIIAPTEPGPQAGMTGGEVAVWTSSDAGATWRKLRQLTAGSLRNHTYVRKPVGAHLDFYALWADGDGHRASVSHLYFTNRAGDRVWRLPPKMTGRSARPEPVAPPAQTAPSAPSAQRPSAG